jgi:hypothetical protein
VTDQDAVEAVVRAELGRIAADAVQALQQVGVPVPVSPCPPPAAGEVAALRAEVDRLTRQRAALIRLCKRMLRSFVWLPGDTAAVTAPTPVRTVGFWRSQLAAAAADDDPPPD